MKKNIGKLLSQGIGGCAVVCAIAIPTVASASEERISLDAWSGAGGSKSRNTGVIATFAPFGSLYQSGFRLIGAGSVGNYEFVSTASPTGTIDGDYTEVSAQLGYSFVGPVGNISLAAGPSISDTKLSFDAPNGSASGRESGLKLSFSGYTPVGSSGFLLGGVSHSTANKSSYYMSKLGFGVWGDLKAGPEASFATGRDYSERRFGLHLTGLKLGKLDFGLAGGVREDQNDKRGGYVQISGRAVY